MTVGAEEYLLGGHGRYNLSTCAFMLTVGEQQNGRDRRRIVHDTGLGLVTSVPPFDNTPRHQPMVSWLSDSLKAWSRPALPGRAMHACGVPGRLVVRIL